MSSHGKPRSPEELIGVVLDQRYLLREILGVGGMGAVFKAVDQTFDQRLVAVKAILPALLRDEDARRELESRFEREANTTASIHHENVVTVYDRGRDREHEMLYLVMEFLEGRNLDQLRLASPGARMSPPRVVFLLAQVCHAMTEVHQRGQLHRDLKPSNILVVQRASGEEVVKVLDFGLARPAATAGPADALTREGQVLGTLRYIAPEQIRLRPDSPLDRRCDIYSLGCVAYHLVAGRAPFEAHERDGDWALLKAHTERAAERVDRCAGVGKALADVIERAMAKEPNGRFPHMDALRRALLAAVRPQASSEIGPLSAAPEIDPSAPPSDAPLSDATPGPFAYTADAAPEPPPTVLSRPTVGAAPASELPTGDARATRLADASARRPPTPKRLVLSPERLRVPALAGGLVAADRPVLLHTPAGPALFFEHAGSGAIQICFQGLAGPQRERPPVALTASPSSALWPAAVPTARGAMIVWADSRLGTRQEGPQLHAGVVPLSASGPPPGPAALRERQLARSAGLPQAPALARVRGGGAVLAWHEVARDAMALRLLLLDAEGSPRTPPVNAGSGSFPAMALGLPSDGGEVGLLAWHEPGVGILGRQLRATDGISLPTAPVVLVSERGAAFPALLQLRDGDFLLAWWSPEPLPGIKLTRLHPDGTPRGELRLLGGASRVPHRPALAPLGADLAACWIAAALGAGGEQEEALVVAYLQIGGGAIQPIDSQIEIARDRPRAPALLALPSDKTGPRDGAADGLLVAWRSAGRWAPLLGVARLDLEGDRRNP